ncbi:MAG: putative DNA binding domain-containing protein [Firmicutes bacterium]|nr:putative DNA binding domain-containing protein [Bacillota bacterium]
MKTHELLVEELRKMPSETSWLEFKHNKYEFDMIGEDISALSNSAALYERARAYMVWGINDETHEIVGTDYDPLTLKKGGQELESWLRIMLSKNANFEFHNLTIEDKKVVLLIIYSAVSQPVSFKKTDYIRVGSYTKKLSEYPAMQVQLWDRLRSTRFEELFAKTDLTLDAALSLLDYGAYFDLKQEVIPNTQEGVLYYLEEEKVVVKQDNGLYAITNMGAILFAKKLSSFPSVSRKAIRVVQYNGSNRLDMAKELVGNKGYAIGFVGLLDYIDALLPSSEVINGAVREKKSLYPSIALREAIANALIHQDFSITGTGPVVEIFDSRIEITNPGIPLIDTFRIIDNPPKSRNEMLASLMRRLRMCEELGTGWDKIVLSCELHQLPAPKISLYEQNTRVILFSEVPFANLTPDDKLWSCYLHACIKQVSGDVTTNRSLRNRFGLTPASSASISRLLKTATEAGLIKPIDPDTAPKHMKYIPYWA